MKEHIIYIAVTAITASLADALSPASFKKYIRILLGFIILFVIISPLAELKGIKIPEIETLSEQNQFELSDNITENLKANVERDIDSRIKDEFGIILKSEVLIDTDDEHKIKGVKKITLDAPKIPEKVINRLKEVYGCENIERKNK